MTTVDEHLAAVLDQITPVREVTLPLAQAYGLVLTQDVTSPVDLRQLGDGRLCRAGR